MKVFYHNDMDGICSARVILNFLRGQKKEYNEEDFISMDYTKDFPLNDIQKDEEIYIVDYSIDPEQMYELLLRTCRVVWIDHHKSAIEKYKNFKAPLEEKKAGWEIPGLRFDGIAASVLTWWYFNGRQFDTADFCATYPKNPNCYFRKEIPEHIQLAGDWDVWDHIYGDRTKAFTMYFNAHIDSPFADEIFEKFTTNQIGGIIADGMCMIEYRNSWAKTFMKKYGYETIIEGYSAFVANLGNANSEFFGDLIDKYDIVATTCFNGAVWISSLYSNKEDVDCSEICLKYGGGGHKGAAGFTSKEKVF